MEKDVHHCKNKKVCADNNLLVLSPNIAKEWAKDLNGDKTPVNTLNGSGYRAWWLCDKGHYFPKRVRKFPI